MAAGKADPRHEANRNLGPSDQDLEGAAYAVDDLIADGASPKRVKKVVSFLASSAKRVGTRGVLGGRWAAEVLMGLSSRITVRDRAAIVAHHRGKQGRELAEALVRNASRTTATVGAAAGALATVQEFAPPAWLALPLELAAETIVVAAIEVKLVAELHEVFGAPVPGTGTTKTRLLLASWAERRGVTPAGLLQRRGQLPRSDMSFAGQGAAELARDEVLRVVRKRLVKAMGGNVASLGPLLTGAVAGAEINRRTTRGLGRAVIDDLVRQYGWPGTAAIGSAPTQ